MLRGRLLPRIGILGTKNTEGSSTGLPFLGRISVLGGRNSNTKGTSSWVHSPVLVFVPAISRGPVEQKECILMKHVKMCTSITYALEQNQLVPKRKEIEGETLQELLRKPSRAKSPVRHTAN